MSRIIEGIGGPADLKAIPEEELEGVCRELREYVVEVITAVGGHLGASLGVVELTVALHRVFDSPRDVFCWDVGHQGYIHKILTGRRERFPTIRQHGGLSGFLKRSESEHDHFGAGHASTSISAALGFAEASRRSGSERHVVAVIGDGAMSGGLAFEGLNNAGNSQRDLLVILNDNNMSISPNVGALSRYFTEVTTSPLLNRLRDQVWDALGKLPAASRRMARDMAHRVEESMRTMVVPGMFFDELGFRYFGPVDGHDLTGLIRLLERLRDLRGPKVLHVLTVKGKGLSEAERDPVSYHGVGSKVVPSDLAELQPEGRSSAPSYNDLVSGLLEDALQRDKRVVAITAAMSEGTGLKEFADRHPDHFFDVGIAEGHAVTFAAGLAAGGLRPVACIYSTFLQRAYDHLVHDVALQRLPVVFLLDRAGLVGADGPTHHGSLDLAYLSSVPGMVLAAPRNGNELRDLLHCALAQDQGPFAIRYPKDNSFAWDPAAPARELAVGSWELLREGRDAALLAVGAMVEEALQAAELLAERKISLSVVNARFVKPLDGFLLERLCASHPLLVCIEEGTGVNGFGAMVRMRLDELGFAGRFLSLTLPDDAVEHGERRVLLDQVGLTGPRIADRVRGELDR